jgi:DNA relaxase NicK
VNERIQKLAEQAGFIDFIVFNRIESKEQVIEKFAQLIVQECTQVLFDESERLFGLYSEETNMQQAEEYEICSTQCTNDISLIEKHFGVEE